MLPGACYYRNTLHTGEDCLNSVAFRSHKSKQAGNYDNSTSENLNFKNKPIHWAPLFSSLNIYFVFSQLRFLGYFKAIFTKHILRQAIPLLSDTRMESGEELLGGVIGSGSSSPTPYLVLQCPLWSSPETSWAAARVFSPTFTLKQDYINTPYAASGTICLPWHCTHLG